MRFYEDGPDIPDSLIEARDRGEVVFFCGAGISAPAGLPDFGGLADDLLDHLAAQESRDARAADQSLDRVFLAMVKEFGGAAVDRAITRALRTPRRANLEYHRAAIDLSRGADGVAKIVTTNFDLLFERADRGLRPYVPPALPDLTQLQPIQGIVYLHGRLNRSSDARAGYIITSADFGRAYLAEGWAARFVRDLSERYTIVLLGYSANDPPMRYLLEGLNSRDAAAHRAPIYAFVSEGSAAEESWYDKGVTPLAYRPRDRAHNGLWDSLFAWAETARNPDGWRAKLVALAQRQPAELAPFERGQVAHLVGTRAGALAFASAEPRPPAEWLCVLDLYSRYAEPRRQSWDDDRELDPLDLFGLNHDPPRPASQHPIRAALPGEDFLGWRRGDQHWPERQRLTGYRADWSNELPGRLFQLARWFGFVMDQPAAIWWAAGQAFPHPGLVREIGYRLDRGAALPEAVRQFWRCYLEAARAQAADPHDLGPYDIVERIGKEGWTNAVLRELEHAFAPSFRIERSAVGPIPPAGDWNSLNLHHLAQIKVTITRWAEELAPPPDKLVAVIGIVRRALIRMAEMLGECPFLYWRTPTLHPTGDRGENFDPDRKTSHFLNFKTMFDALVVADLDAARREVATWDSNDPVFFAKLFLYAAADPRLVTAENFGQRLLAMPDDLFWGDMARELLFALRAQWPLLGPRARQRIEARIVRGRPRYEQETRRDHRQNRSAFSASWLRWLEGEGLALSAPTVARLPALIAAHPRWSDAWIAQADDSDDPRGGYVERVTDTRGLEDAPIGEIIALARARSTSDIRALRDHRPFDGLVGEAPFKALSALRFAARQQDYPATFWHSLLEHWPPSGSVRLDLLLAHDLAKIPDPLFVELRHAIASWAQKHLVAVIQQNRRSGLAALDAIIARYAGAAPTTLASGIGNSSVGGVVQVTSEVSVMKGLNAPGGKLALLLIALLGKPTRRRAMPAWIGTRLLQLLTLPGDGGGHAAAMIARQYRWFDYWFADWTAALTPYFALDHYLAEGMWHGLTANPAFIGDAAGRRLKPALCGLLRGETDWTLDDDARRTLVGLMVNLTMARDGASAVISFAEARRLLIAGSGTDRAEALGMLARSMRTQDLWATLIRPFLLEAWPRQLRYQTEASARHFAHMAEEAHDRFPEVVALILPLLRPIAHLDTLAYRLKKQGEGSEGYAMRFPAETLALLNASIGEDPQTRPWNLDELLDQIAEAAPELRQSDPWRRLKGLGG